MIVGAGYLGPALSIRGLTICLDDFVPDAAALVSNCDGSVSFEDCVIDSTAGPGARANGCASVVFTRCAIDARGPFLPAGSIRCSVNASVDVLGSNAFVFESAATGTSGKLWSLVQESTSVGGPGLHVDGGYVPAQGCNIAGGVGGTSSSLGGAMCVPLSDGGPGRTVIAGDVRDVLAEQRVFGIAAVVREDLQVVAATVGVPGDLTLRASITKLEHGAAALALRGLRRRAQQDQAQRRSRHQTAR